MSDCKRVTSFSLFVGKLSGHGGEKRTKQVELLVKEHHSYQLIQTPSVFNSLKPVSIKNQIRRSIYIPEVLSSPNRWQDFRLRYIFEDAYKFFRQDKFLLSQEHLFVDADTVLWENNFPAFSHMLGLLKSRYLKRVV